MLEQEQQLPEGAVPLSMLPPGRKARIVAVMAGWRASQRALSLGLAPGMVIEVVENNHWYPWTPIIVKVHGVHVAVGRGLASKIYVLPLDSSGGPGGPS